MLLAVCGQARSGTTLLRRVCDSHPQISLTHEYGLLLGLGQTRRKFIRFLGRRCWGLSRGMFTIARRGGPRYWLSQGRRIQRVWRDFLSYLLSMPRFTTADIEAVETCLRRSGLRGQYVGDKAPAYSHRLQRLCRLGVRCVVVVRDPRDVICSSFNRMRRSPEFLPDLRRGEPLALLTAQWLKGIKELEAVADQVYWFRYEDLVRDPDLILNGLSEWLGLDAQGFEPTRVHPRSVGRFREELSRRQQREVLELAGSVMERYQYFP